MWAKSVRVKSRLSTTVQFGGATTKTKNKNKKQDLPGQDRTWAGRLDRTGQDRTWAGQDRTGAGQDRTGLDRTGQDRSWTQETGVGRQHQQQTSTDEDGNRNGDIKHQQQTSNIKHQTIKHRTPAHDGRMNEDEGGRTRMSSQGGGTEPGP